MDMNDRLSKGVRMLEEQGHVVEGRIQYDKMWWEIDHRMLATPEEIGHLADGVYSLSELEELYIKRRAEEEAAK
jgi:hypothetical protein